MTTIKRFLTLSLIATLAVSVWGERVSQEDAATVANNFMNVSTSTSGARKAGAAKRMVLKKTASKQEENQYYVYENADGEGWVMVAANDIARPIIAYSDEGHFRFDNQPANVKSWLGKYNKQIRQAEQDSVQATEEVKLEWKKLRKGTGIRKGTPVVAALIQTKWDQDEPYWNQCPTIGSERCLTGCVATAMAQVMNYWQWPVTGTGSASVTVNGQNYSVDFSTGNYDWNNMLDKYRLYYNDGDKYYTSTTSGTTTQQNAVAKLMYHCGVAAEMDYGTDVSGAYTIYPNKSNTSTRCAQYALIHNFGYNSSTIKGYYRPGGYGYSSVSDATWHNYLKTELDAARPIMYAGADNEGGHSFICDGYDNTTPTRKYHFNWGWSGYCDGYYDIDNLVPGTGGSGAGNGSYNNAQDIIIGIMPPQVGHNINLNGTGCSLSADKIRVENGNSVTVTITPTDATYDYTSTTVQLGSATISSSNYTLSANKQTLTINGSAITGDASNALTITVVWTKNRYKYDMLGENCTEELSGMLEKNAPLNLTITPDAGYTLADASCWDVTMGGTPLTYGTDFTYNASTGAFSITSVTGDVEILAYGGHTVTWSVQGITSTTTFADGAALVLPDNPSDCSGVGGKKFVGWTANSSVDGSAPADLFTAAGTKTVTANTTYYAVYATASGSGGGGSTVTLNASTDTSFPKDGISLTTSNGVLDNGTDYRIYKGATLTITSTVGNMSSIAFTFDGSYDGGGWASSYTPNSNTWTSPACTSGSSGKQARITQIVITVGSGGGTSYSDYSLECSTCTLSSISLNTSGVTKVFTQGDVFSAEGLVVTAIYSDCASRNVSPTSISSPDMSTIGGKTITVSYTEGDITRNNTYTITVNAAPTYKIRFFDGATKLKEEDLLSGATATPPSDPAGCTDYTFYGWWTETLSASNTTAHKVNDFTVTGAQDYYAVYEHSEGGGSSSTITLNASTDTSFPKEGITLTTSSGVLNNGTDYRIYKGGTLTITSSVGDMSSIVFTFDGSYDGGGWASSYTPNANTWTSPACTSGSSGTQARITKIDITVGGGGTTYYTTTAVCVECTNKVTLTKGEESHGTFSLNKANGAYNNCTSNFAVTVSGITPVSGYYCTGVTATGGHNEVTGPDGSGNYTVTYEKGYSVTSTITANFAPNPTYTVTWSMNGDESHQDSYEEGESIVFPASATGCDDKVFRGWSEVTVAETDVEPSYVTSATMPAHDVTYYAVFADEDESGSGGNTYTLVEESLTDWSGNYIIVNYSDNNKAMKNTVSDGEFGSKNISPSSKQITTTDNTIIWIFEEGTGDNASKYSVKSKDSGKYAAIGSTTTSGSLNDAASYFTITHYGSSHQNDVAASSGRFFSYYSSGATFRTYAGTSNGVYLYRSSTSYSGFTTSCVTPTEVTVSFNANGGEGTMDPQVMSYNTATALQANTFTREGYSFQGWATTPAGAKVYNDAASVTFKKNTTLYAVWQKNSYTITLNDLEHGSLETSPATTAEYGATVTVTVTPSSGYLFGSITVINNSTSTTIATSGSGATQTFTMPASDVTITATVSPIPTYTVTWSMNGDESLQDSYEESESIVFPASATGCDDKVFRGWSEVTVAETDVEPSYVTSATMPAHNVTYYAVYAEESGSGGTPSSESYAFTNKSWHASEGNWTSGQDGAGYNNSGVQVTTGASGANATCPNSYSNISSIVVSYCTNGSSGAGSITMGIGSTSLTNTITKTGGTTARNTTFDFSGTTPTGNPHITVTCTTNSIYICGVTIYYGSSATYTGYTTTCGASITSPNIGWITSSAGQKVKRVVEVSAKNFDDATTLIATCANSNFHVTLAETAVPAGSTGLTTTLSVEYTPTAQGREEDVEIVLTADDKSRTITVSGRCVPEDFLLITKKSSTWYALPANMTSGPDEYAGVEVSPNDATTPTVVPVSPTTTVYALVSVADSRYADHGNCVRLVGNNNLCLWSNMANSTGKTNIQNKTSAATAATDNHDWLLSTTDGVHYTIANPHHPQYGEGRRLAYGTKFGMYAEETEFFIVSAGCSSQPGEVAVSPHRVEATFSWVSNASSMTIDLYTNELMTEGHKTATASSSPYIFTGLEESTPYWYKLTPGTDSDCAVTGSFTTTGPAIDIVEWQENGVVLFIDNGEEVTPMIVIDGQEEHGSITGGGGDATELFFAKYFEGAGSMKLVSVFNGTKNDINLSNYTIYVRMRGSSAWAPTNDVTLDLSSLGSIKAGQEIIFFSRPLPSETGLAGCSNDFLDDKVDNHSSVESNPRWVECDGGTFKRINFNGNDPILLKKSGSTIDIIGSEGEAPTATNCLSGDSEKGWGGTVRNMDKGKSPSHPDFNTFYEASSQSPVTTQDSIDLLSAFGINLTADEIDLTTARCIFFRDKRITCGDSAVLMNGSTFVTFTNHDAFTSEWYGRSVCMNDAARTAAGVSNDAQATCNSYQDIANMDYNEYYLEWHNIDPGTSLEDFTYDPATNEYIIPIDNMRQYTCLNLRFQLVQGENVLTEATQQVPIIVKGDVDTNDPLFSELVIDQSTHLPSYTHSVERCKNCDVIVLGSASLTKGNDAEEKDVPEVGNVKVYPGGTLVVPSGTTYTMKSLALRRQEDIAASANIEGDIIFSSPTPTPARKDEGEKPLQKTPSGDVRTYLDLRIDPTNWHYISLPYDCNVADIRFANPEETTIPVLGTDYLIKWYNGEKRAATQAGGCWEMVAADATLKAGLGYIFSIPGEGNVKREFRFPLDNDVIAQEKADKLVNSVYGYGCDRSLTEVRANHRGWNLLGNPYLMPYSTDITTPLETGLIVEDHSTDPWDGHYKFDENSRTNNLRYIVEPVNNGWSGYNQVSIEDYPMKPFTSYFVQVGAGDPVNPDPYAEQGINFHQSRVEHSPVRRAPSEYEETEDTHPVWCAVTLTNPKGEKDETTMLISNDFTDGYDMMNDLIKWRGSYYQYTQITTAPVLASCNKEGEMAFNALPDSSALAGIPLNYFAASQGFYTFAYDDKYDKDMEVKEVKLWDKTTHQWYDLMNEPYSFSTARMDNTDRFILSIRIERKQEQVTTNLEDVSSFKGEKPRKLLINGHVYIQRGKDIYDVTGKQMLNR